MSRRLVENKSRASPDYRAHIANNGNGHTKAVIRPSSNGTVPTAQPVTEGCPFCKHETSVNPTISSNHTVTIKEFFQGNQISERNVAICEGHVTRNSHVYYIRHDNIIDPRKSK